MESFCAIDDQQDLLEYDTNLYRKFSGYEQFDLKQRLTGYLAIGKAKRGQ